MSDRFSELIDDIRSNAGLDTLDEAGAPTALVGPLKAKGLLRNIKDYADDIFKRLKPQEAPSSSALIAIQAVARAEYLLKLSRNILSLEKGTTSGERRASKGVAKQLAKLVGR